MATTLSSLLAETQLSASAATILQAGSSEKYFFGKAVFTNTSSSSVEVTVWILESGTTATTGSGGNWMVKKTIPPGKTWLANEIKSNGLGNSQKLVAQAGTASVVNVRIFGAIET